MTTVFIAGSIKIKHLDRKFKERIDKIITASPPIFPPVHAPTSQRKTWPWPKRRTTPGTLSNVIELLGRKKKSAVFVNKSKEFMTVGDVAPKSSIGRPCWRACLNMPGTRRMRS